MSFSDRYRHWSLIRSWRASEKRGLLVILDEENEKMELTEAGKALYRDFLSEAWGYD